MWQLVAPQPYLVMLQEALPLFGHGQSRCLLSWIMTGFGNLTSMQVEQRCPVLSGRVWEPCTQTLHMFWRRGAEHDFDGQDASLDEDGTDGVACNPAEQGLGGRNGAGGQGCARMPLRRSSPKISLRCAM
jgi:hypothetical protein